jgi:hypothetical protein
VFLYDVGDLGELIGFALPFDGLDGDNFADGCVSVDVVAAVGADAGEIHVAEERFDVGKGKVVPALAVKEPVLDFFLATHGLEMNKTLFIAQAQFE